MAPRNYRYITEDPMNLGSLSSRDIEDYLARQTDVSLVYAIGTDGLNAIGLHDDVEDRVLKQAADLADGYLRYRAGIKEVPDSAETPRDMAESAASALVRAVGEARANQCIAAIKQSADNELGFIQGRLLGEITEEPEEEQEQPGAEAPGAGETVALQQIHFANKQRLQDM